MPIIMALVILTPLLMGFKWDSSKFMSTDEIRPGMKGEALTVLQGTKIERLKLRILSVQKNAFPKSNLIRAIGTDDTFKRIGVVSGMSGSPVYIDGRLIGAIAYAYYYSKEPIMGITPIESMLKVFDYMERPKPKAPGGIGLLPFFSAEEMLARINEKANRSIDEPIRSPGELKPVKMPIAISGFSEGATKALKAMLSGYNIMLVEGGGGEYPDLSPPIQPGAVVGTEFVRGDLTAFGYGTVTYRDGDKILIFGHPDFGEGDVNLPLSGGYVHCIIPSFYVGFKLAGATKPFGAMKQDREFACAGVIGKVPGYIPVKVHVTTSRNKVEEYNYEVARHKLLTPSFITSVVWSTIDAAEKETGKYTVKVRSLIQPKEYPAIVKEDVFSGEASPGLAAASLLYPVSTLMRNSFQELEIEKVELEIKIEDKRNTALIEEARIDKRIYKPGEKVRLTLSIRPYLENPIRETLEIQLPKDIPEGPVMMIIGSASAILSWDKSRAPQKYVPKNIQQLMQIIQRGEKNDHLVVELFVPRPGLTISGEELPDLPISMFYVMNSSQQTGEVSMTKGTTLLREVIPTDFVLSGSKILRFTVSRRAR
ncbi:hypothetical protein J7M22_13410 [Candidatus Poribacteria bacterium]|nr:hypothetical protein [Candidatus Poribacteria bacterium]